MREETKKRVDGMTREEQERRLAELSQKYGVTNPQSISGGKTPPGHDAIEFIEEMEEREYLKEKLGCKV
jgi:hypothetical protein